MNWPSLTRRLNGSYRTSSPAGIIDVGWSDVAGAAPVLAIYLHKGWWFVLHVPCGFIYPLSFPADHAAHAWAKRFWARLSPTERLQLATSYEAESVVRASTPAWEAMRQERPQRQTEQEMVG